MSQVITGIIQAIETRQVAGGRTAYNIIVGGESYGAGLFKPKANEGDYVQFTLDDSRGYKNVARNSLKVSTNKPSPEAVQEAKATAPARAADGSVTTLKEQKRQEWEEKKQEIIARQSARNTAISYLSVLAAADALGLPASGTKGKKQEALDALLSKYTQEFYTESTGQEWKLYDKANTSHSAGNSTEEGDSLPDDTPWE